jgi:hypothetical protein
MAYAHCRLDNSEYVTIIDLPRQQWLWERTSLLRYTRTACRLKICGCCFLITKIFNVTKKEITNGVRSLPWFSWNKLY